MDKQPWLTPEGREVWKSEAGYRNWLRGAIRRIWSDYPIRKVWKANSLRPVTVQERLDRVFHPSTKNVGQCVFCKEWMAGSRLEVDHKLPSLGCKTKEEIEQFLWHCGGLIGNDFQLACEPCHKIKSYADGQGLSFEEAEATKTVIVMENNGTLKEQLKRWGIVPASNQEKRRKQAVDYLIKLGGRDSEWLD